MDTPPSGIGHAAQRAKLVPHQIRIENRRVVAWALTSLVISLPTNLIISFFGGLNSSLNATDPPGLIVAEVIAIVAACATLIVLAALPLLSRAEHGIRMRRRARSTVLAAALSPLAVLVAVLSSK